MHSFTSLRLGIGLLIVASLLILSGTISYAQPRIEFEHTVYDFGEVIQGENVTHTYRFQNVGDEVLKIEKVKTS